MSTTPSAANWSNMASSTIYAPVRPTPALAREKTHGTKYSRKTRRTTKHYSACHRKLLRSVDDSILTVPLPAMDQNGPRILRHRSADLLQESKQGGSVSRNPLIRPCCEVILCHFTSTILCCIRCLTNNNKIPSER